MKKIHFAVRKDGRTFAACTPEISITSYSRIRLHDAPAAVTCTACRAALPPHGYCAAEDKSGQHGCVLPAGHEGNHESSDSYRGHPATQFDRNGWIVRTLDQVKEAVEVELNDRFGYCAGCGGEEYVLVGRLGNRVHVRCRNCGLDASAEVR